MSEDLSKIHRMRRILRDEDPTDCSPIPPMPKESATPAADGADIEMSQARLTRLSTPERVATPNTDLLERQRNEISELRKEISRLHAALVETTNGPEASADSGNNQDDTESSTINQQPAVNTVNRILLVLNGNQRFKYPLFKESMTIGRGPENDIQLATEYVSRVHARITSNSRGATIEDLNSRNGLVVNSNRVGRTQLRNGDLIAIGKMQFKFIDLMDDDSGEGQA